MENDKELDTALYKFGLISPLIHLDNEAVRETVARSIVEQEHTMPHSGKTRLTKKTLGNYQKRYKQKGFEGLKRKKRSDRDLYKGLSPVLQEKITELKKEDPKRSSRLIIRLIKAQKGFENSSLHERTVSRFMKKNGLTRKHLLPKKIHYSFEKEKINALWQSDISDGIYLSKEKKMSYLFAFIDDYSRLVPHAEFYPDEKSPRLEDCLKKAILKRGIPEVLYVDNGKVFDSTHLKRICAELGIRLLHHLPYTPESKGKIERFFLRAQREFFSEASHAGIGSLEELNSFFMTWLEIEYHRVEHHSIGTTPLDRYIHDFQKHKPRTVESLEEITEIFLYREKRNVNKQSGIIKLNGNLYQVKEYALLSHDVEVRFDPFDMSRVFVYHEGKYVQQAHLRTLKNQVFAKVPEEDQTPEAAVRKSSVDYLSRLKQKELEIRQKEFSPIDFSRQIGEDKKC